jgi:5,10-methylenetetrahydromethanopterin reductase
MRFVTGIGRNESIHEIGAVAKAAEDAGFWGITCVDQPHLSRDVYVMLARVAESTSRIKLGHGVTQIGTVHPVVIANATASIDELSNGRAFVGIGAGGNALLTMGQKPRPLREVREAINFIRDFMSGGEATYQGATMHSEWVRSPVPIYMACAGPKSCVVGGAVSDGVISVGVDPTVIEWRRELVDRGAVENGRGPGEVELWVRTLVYVCDRKQDAHREVASYTATQARDMYLSVFTRDTPDGRRLESVMERRYPGLIDEIRLVYENFNHYDHERTDASHNRYVTQRMIDFFNLTGTADEIRDRVGELERLGIRTLSTVQYTLIDKVEMLKVIGQKLVPAFS